VCVERPSDGPKGLYFGHFQSVARSGQSSLAQGLPWEIPPSELALKGRPTGYGENWLRTFEPDRMRISSPFRAKRLFGGQPRVNPISANLFCKISAHRRVHAGGPGAGRAKLRLSRGFPRCLAHDVTPYGIGRPSNSWEVTEQGRMTRETLALIGGRSPGRGSVRTGVSGCPSPDHVIPPQILGSSISHRPSKSVAFSRRAFSV
jgi:hypothetical protein